MRSWLMLISIFMVIEVGAQANRKYTRTEYIDTYKEMAMKEMARTGIPASITLAQGLLESGNGNSTLAVKSNNHFGIKCHDWDGPSVRHDDDAKNECFRKYKSPEQSYKDHSDFLTASNRYSELFELASDDYKAWAKGLKKAGYATSPTYSKALIEIIEDNQLYVYDSQVLVSKGKNKTGTTGKTIANRDVLYNNRVKYILAKKGDSYASLTEELSMFSYQLTRYNDASYSDTLGNGDFVYLQPKRSRTYGKQKTHLVALGESIHSISQHYAIKEEKLRQRNNIPENMEPTPGALLLLKGKLNGTASPALIDAPLKDKKTDVIDKDPVDSPEFEIEYDLGS
jgi:hypothetical protein